MGRVLMWPVVISDSVNLHSFADPPPSTSIIPRQRGHCLHSASIYQSIRTALSLSRQEQIAGSRIAIIGFSVKIPTFHSGFNTRGGASLQLHLFPIKLGCLADMDKKIDSLHTCVDLLKHTKLVFYRSLMSLEYMLTKLKLIFMIMPFFWEGHHAPPPPAVCCDRVRKYLRSFLFHTGKIPKLLNCTYMHH